MTTIFLPYLDFNRHFPTIVALYDAKAAEYNGQVAIERDSGDRSRNFLKSSHRELYFDLIRAIKGKMASDMLVFKDAQKLLAIAAGSMIVLQTNRKRLSERTKKSEVTIYRLIERLIDARILTEKVNHGTQRDFELHLRPDMVPVSDAKSEKFNPLAFILKNSIDSAIQETLRSICTPCSSNKNSFNNKIITGNLPEHDAVSPAVMNYNEQTRTIHGNTGDPVTCADELFASKIAKINMFAGKGILVNAFGVSLSPENDLKINTSKNKAGDYGRKIEELRKKEEERSRIYSMQLVEFVISILFGDRTIYKAEREKAYKHAQYYFKMFNTGPDCERAMEGYRERVRMVQRYLEKHKEFDFSNIFPARYMDPENYQCSFIMTQKWLKKQKEYHELQQKTRKLKTEEAILTYALTRMVKWKNPSSFEYWKTYVINKAPGKVMDYETRALSIIKSAN